MNLRMKNFCFCLVLLAVLAVGAYGASCDDCLATYNAATKTCTVANAFITCMEDAVNPGCPTSTANLVGFIGQLSSCSLTTLCTCQKDHLVRWSEWHHHSMRERETEAWMHWWSDRFGVRCFYQGTHYCHFHRHRHH
ncbi:uncharacterized protein LOC124256137 isoform X2 [Haliotis rubra]|uniref:uncharacterized protein LOC124256137 isoform X1 n=1 Tax=Haliotis rubra TaxID=36100 RepID=UPI001EE5CAED|nr:uncharacterized protein LOC124256137 isoform X1 [Haliotis rubra]XP_046546051.1 uncharacterized protein LOC124256137 isoform X2 [Haliotis rubra]